VTSSVLDSGASTAQVTPLELTQKLMKAAVENGAKYVQGMYIVYINDISIYPHVYITLLQYIYMCRSLHTKDIHIKLAIHIITYETYTYKTYNIN
jgi:hypothetical protein